MATKQDENPILDYDAIWRQKYSKEQKNKKYLAKAIKAVNKKIKFCALNDIKNLTLKYKRNDNKYSNIMPKMRELLEERGWQFKHYYTGSDRLAHHAFVRKADPTIPSEDEEENK